MTVQLSTTSGVLVHKDAESRKKMLESLKLRSVTPKDFDKLIELRVECGWGEAHVREKFLDPDYPLCFILAEIEGKEEIVGMGGWKLREGNNADPVTGFVKVTGLFIQPKYQGLGWGTRALELLEEGAVERFSAKFVTLDTATYHVLVDKDSIRRYEDQSKPNPNVAWYQKRGYVIYNGPVLYFPDETGDPTLTIHGYDLKKDMRSFRA